MSSITRRYVDDLLIGLIIILVIVGRASNSTYAQTTSTVPAPWVAENIGNPPPNGSSAVNDNGFDISVNGAGPSSTGDRLHFVYQTLADDIRIAVRVDSLAPAQMSSTAGLTMRTSLQSTAPQASVVVSGDGQLSFQRRKLDGGVITTTTSDVHRSAPQWLGLERRGMHVSAYSSSDGQTWEIGRAHV